MLDELRSEKAFDKYILFLLGLGFMKSEVAAFCGVSVPHVYNVIERNSEVIERWGIDIGDE